MAKIYSIEEIDNINLGRHAKFGEIYTDVRGYVYEGVEENRLKKLITASQIVMPPSLLTPNITNVYQAITNI